jgi:transposase
LYRKEIIVEGRDRARFSPEFKDEAVRLVIESGRPIAQIARELQINDGTLGNWVARYRDEHPVSEAPLSLSERARLGELERENRQLRLDNEFLGKAAAFFAKDRR